MAWKGIEVMLMLLTEKGKSVFRKFYKAVWPRLTGDEVLTAVIVARKKYANISRSEELLAYEILKHDDFSYVWRRLKRLGYVKNIYVDYKTGKPIPAKAMTLYVDLHPKSVLKAYEKLIAESLVEAMFVKQSTTVAQKFKNLDRHWFSCICRSRTRKPVYLVDIDVKDQDVLQQVVNCLESDVLWITETRGGYHIIINNENPGARFYFDRKKRSIIWMHDDKREELRLPHVEVHYDQAQTPVPGSMQGGYFVKGDKP